jgi:hypothetical protein
MNLNKNLAISENGFVFNASTGDSFSINETGSFIINLLKEGKSKSEIIEKIQTEFNAEKSNIEKDLSEFIKVLQNHQLLTGNE